MPDRRILTRRLGLRVACVAALTVCVGLMATARTHAVRTAHLEHEPSDLDLGVDERTGPDVDEQLAPSQEARSDLRTIASDEAIRWADRLPGHVTSAAAGGLAWSNLGPTEGTQASDAGQVISTADSGRVNVIRADPRSLDVVYVATAGGGVWKSENFTQAARTWRPLTDGLPDLAIGGMDLDPSQPSTLYIGTGDPFQYAMPGGQVFKSVDGGTTWMAPSTLSGSSPGSANANITASRIRDLRVDPNNANIIMVATDVGLFRSTDAGSNFSLIDLPNGSGPALEEAIWSFAYVGRSSGASTWLVSGVVGCKTGASPPVLGWAAGAPQCPLGNPGDLWRSDDAGATWISLRGQGQFPISGVSDDVGRMTIAAGTTTDPSKTPVFVFVANSDEHASKTLGILRSLDGGRSFSLLPFHASNPDGVCGGANISGIVSWNVQAIAVDPTNNSRVFIAGLVCAARTLDALGAAPTWDYVGDTIPGSLTSCGPLPYLHADFHTALVRAEGNGVRVLFGNDGGISSSVNVFSVVRGQECSISWDSDDRGLITHLLYTLASGEPSRGNADVLFTGTQDIGTRLRDPAHPSHFNHVTGGDGTGTAIAYGPSGPIYWSAVTTGPAKSGWYFCKPQAADCSDRSSWQMAPLTLPAGDTQPFTKLYSPILTDPAGTVLTHTQHNVWRGDSDGNFENVSGGAFASDAVMGVVASPNIPRLYGAALNGQGTQFGGRAAVSSDAGSTWTRSSVLGIGITPDTQLPSASALAFPPSVPDGVLPGDYYVAASAAYTLKNGTAVPPTASDARIIGHLFATHDRGTTWVPISGDGSGGQLPNVPVHAIVFDPSDPTSQTMLVANDLGVYRTKDAGASWERLGSGLPMVRVTGLFISSDGQLIRASTFGRGLWELGVDSGPGDGGGSGSDAPMAGGCGCRSSHGGLGGALAWIGVAFVVVRRRRRPAGRGQSTSCTSYEPRP